MDGVAWRERGRMTGDGTVGVHRSAELNRGDAKTRATSDRASEEDHRRKEDVELARKHRTMVIVRRRHMEELEGLIGLILAAVILAAAARRVGAPYPVFLALGGALLAFLPGGPSFTVLPELALALFLAPVLLDAAYDASPRDLRDNWAPLTGLVVFAVGLTTIAVAVVARTLIPAMPWAPAIALGAVVAPPDAAAATAVLRQLRPPQRILTILEGESLLNDASALLIYRLAVSAVAAHGFSIGAVAPTFLLAVAGSVIVGPLLGWLLLRLTDRVQHVPTAIILQFVGTFGVWILADRIGLSGVLTMVCFAMTVARTAPERTPARIRIPSYAVWETVVFVLNILAFIFIGLQIRPILQTLEPAARGRYFAVAGAVLLTVIVVRVAWHMSFNAVIRWRDRRLGFHPPRPMLRPTVASGLIISWAGMRGIVTLAAALALPAAFPFRDLIVLTAFSVVVGTLVLQGLTLKPLLRALDLQDGDPVGRELGAARERALRAGLASFEADRSPVAEAIRQEFTAHLGSADGDPESGIASRSAHSEIHRGAVQAARQAVLAMRANDEIGDNAFHQMEEELDWLEMAGGGKEPSGPN
jgi:monovalent cation/hydrogen antiporter